MKNRILLSVLFLLVAGCIPTVVKDQSNPSGADFAITWRFLYNIDGEDEFRQVLTIRNNGVTPLGSNWTLYFNFIYGIAPNSVSETIAVTRINGNYYRMNPTASFPGIAAGEEIEVCFNSHSATINAAAMPAGFYFVFNDQDGNASSPQIVQDVSLGAPILPKQSRRGSRDVLAVPSAQSRYYENLNNYQPVDGQFPRLVPQPVEVRVRDGNAVIDKTTAITCDEELSNEASFLADFLALLTGVQPIVINSGEGSMIRLKLEQFEGGSEAYQLSIDPEDGISINGNSPAGVFYGVQSLIAAMPVGIFKSGAERIEIPATVIKDYPRFGYRGIHLDVARNFHSMETVKKFIDLIAFYKLNKLHLHLTDDEGWRLEIEALPELTEVGGRRGHTVNELDRLVPTFGTWIKPGVADGYYSRADYIEILRYANRRHIEVIPEFDMPGHAHAAIAAMEARYHNLKAAGDVKAAEEFRLVDPADESDYRSVQGWDDNVIDVALPSTYRFLATLFDEVIAIYREAGAPLNMIHIGGDEVARGSWDGSAACRELIADDNDIHDFHDLAPYFMERVHGMLQERGLGLAGWEEIALREELIDDKRVNYPNENLVDENVYPYVWNNVAGWGGEDLGNRLANAGFKVVLSSATNLYFDLSYDKDYREPGLSWAGFVNTRKTFEFTPHNIYNCITTDRMGNPVDLEQYADRARLTEEGKQNIVGIQGQLWSELLNSTERLEYMAFPKLIALAERAWSQQPEWAVINDVDLRTAGLEAAWNEFAYWVGRRELLRLDHLYGGVQYRIPPPGAVIEDGLLKANCLYPGLEIRYTTDGSDPDMNASIYSAPVSVDGTVEGTIKIRAFNGIGRSSYTTVVDAKH